MKISVIKRCSKIVHLKVSTYLKNYIHTFHFSDHMCLYDINECLPFLFTHTFIPFTHPIVHTPSLPHYSAQTYTVEKKYP